MKSHHIIKTHFRKFISLINHFSLLFVYDLYLITQTILSMKTIMLLLSFRGPDYCSSAFTTLFTNKSIIKDEPLANRIPQEKHTFISVVIFQTSESTLHSHRNITDTRTLSCHTDVVTRCPSLGAAGFQDR